MADEPRPDLLRDWLFRSLDGVTLPPLCLEIVLRDGARFFVRSMVEREERNRTVVLRVWDVRSFTEADFQELRVALSSSDRDLRLDAPHTLHPKLETGNLRISVDDVSYCLEWFDRLWPREIRGPVGFRRRNSD